MRADFGKQIKIIETYCYNVTINHYNYDNDKEKKERT